MAGRLVLRPGVEVTVTARFAAPAVGRLAQDVAAAARLAAPPGKVWMTVEDERVRPSHRDTDGQEAPGNLRFQLPRYRGGHRVQGYDLGRVPRDPALPLPQRVNCRCAAVDLPDAVARHVQAGQGVANGSRARARVTVTYPRVGESERPDSPDRGGGWMARAVGQVAAAHRAGGRRG